MALVNLTEGQFNELQQGLLGNSSPSAPAQAAAPQQTAATTIVWSDGGVQAYYYSNGHSRELLQLSSCI